MRESHIFVPGNLFLLFFGLLFQLGASGCLATRGWVTEQMTPVAERVAKAEGQLNQAGERMSGVESRLGQIGGRVADVEGRLGQTDAKAEKALGSLANLRLQRRFVLDLKEGANFGFNAATLTDQAKREIDGFFSDLKGDPGAVENALFLVAGHTDSLGSEEHNYELGRRRAESVARYLVTHKKLDPLRVTTVSYGKNVPLADNATREGRGKNRRVEILVYQETIASDPVGAGPRAATTVQEESEGRIKTR